MRKCIILFLLLFSKHISNAQQLDIALNLNDCINCVKYFKDLEPNRVRFILPIDYQEDSTQIIKNYFDNNKVNIVYSDSLYHQYTMGGNTTFSNHHNSLKFSLLNYSNSYKDFFALTNGTNVPNTLTLNKNIYNTKYAGHQYSLDGKVYYNDVINNKIGIYDLKKNQIDTTITITYEDVKKEMYNIWDNKDTANKYMTMLEIKKGKEALFKIDQMELLGNDSLFVHLETKYITNIDAKQDTFISRHPIILLYVNNKLKISFSPPKFSESFPYYVNSFDNHYFNGSFFIRNTLIVRENSNQVLYVKWNVDSNNYMPLVNNAQGFYKSGDLSSARFYKEYMMLIAQPILYNIPQRSAKKLPIFQNKSNLINEIEYIIQEFKCFDNKAYVFTFNYIKKQYEYFIYDMKSEKVVQHDIINKYDHLNALCINPYNFERIMTVDKKE